MAAGTCDGFGQTFARSFGTQNWPSASNSKVSVIIVSPSPASTNTAGHPAAPVYPSLDVTTAVLPYPATVALTGATIKAPSQTALPVVTIAVSTVVDAEDAAA